MAQGGVGPRPIRWTSTCARGPIRGAGTGAQPRVPLANTLPPRGLHRRVNNKLAGSASAQLMDRRYYYPR